MTDKNQLYYFTRFVSEETFDAAKLRAYKDGTVLECNDFAVFAFGVAYRFSVTNGLRDHQALHEIQKKLDGIIEINISDLEQTSSPNARPVAEQEKTHFTQSTLPNPIAIGALDFIPDTEVKIFFPQLAFLRHRDHHPAVIAVAHIDELLDIHRNLPNYFSDTDATIDNLCPDEFNLHSLHTHEHFLNSVRDAVKLINSSELEKVVLARKITVKANRKFNRAILLERLRTLHPSCLTFAIGDFIGASPELLIKKEGAHIISSPLAGTIARSGVTEEDKELADHLVSSEKNLLEHNYVVSYIMDKLSAFCNKEIERPYPELLFLRNVTHIQSNITGELKAPYAGILELVSALHPTPAVAGIPLEASLEAIHRFEEVPRHQYGAPLGFVEKGGNGTFYLGIRSAWIKGNTAELMAGVGIIKDSDPSDELTETQLKLQALLAAIVRP
jgi:isochorismate synthase